jgi:DsbC/DsbD-like thiol-disulfide interchange protein
MLRPGFFASVILLFFCGGLTSIHAEPTQANHSRVELVARQAAVTAGGELAVGVHFMLEKGWHVYWVNPGDSGQPPSFKWQLPEGFSAGEVRWPRPERMQNSPMLADYGYRDDVLLMVPVRVPRNFNAKTAQFSVDARWLICREVCIPDKATLKLAIPSGSSPPNPAIAKLFADTEKNLPAPWPRTWKARVETQTSNFVLTIVSGKPIRKAMFFPQDPDQIDNPSPQLLRVQPRGAAMALRKSELLTKPIATLRGVLVLSDGSAYQLTAPVSAAKAIK